MKQAKMAELLGVPANTLSRWETGATKPDADSLAAMHSIALENSEEIDFSKRAAIAKPATKKGGNATPKPAQTTLAKNISRAGIFLDFQNVGISKGDFPTFNKALRKWISTCFPNLKKSRYRAFAGSGQSLAIFRSNQWSVSTGSGNRDQDIVKAVRDYCKASIKGTALVLITKDGDFAELIKELKGKGVPVYLMAPANPSKKLLGLVDEKHRIPWPA